MDVLTAIRVVIEIFRSGTVLERKLELWSAIMILLKAAGEYVLQPGADGSDVDPADVDEQEVIAMLEAHVAAADGGESGSYAAFPIDWKALVSLLISLLAQLIKG